MDESTFMHVFHCLENLAYSDSSLCDRHVFIGHVAHLVVSIDGEQWIYQTGMFVRLECVDQSSSACLLFAIASVDDCHIGLSPLSKLGGEFYVVFRKNLDGVSSTVVQMRCLIDSPVGAATEALKKLFYFGLTI